MQVFYGDIKAKLSPWGRGGKCRVGWRDALALKAHELSSPRDALLHRGPCGRTCVAIWVLELNWVSFIRAVSFRSHILGNPGTHHHDTAAFPTGNLAPCCRWVGSAAGSTPVGEVSEPCPMPPGHGTAPADPSPGLAGCSGICGRRLRGWGRRQMPRWFLPSSRSREGYLGREQLKGKEGALWGVGQEKRAGVEGMRKEEEEEEEGSKRLLCEGNVLGIAEGPFWDLSPGDYRNEEGELGCIRDGESMRGNLGIEIWQCKASGLLLPGKGISVPSTLLGFRYNLYWSHDWEGTTEAVELSKLSSHTIKGR